jgi:Uma2 family endonuclease
MSYVATLESLLASPALPELLEHGKRAFAAEQAIRRKFLNDITPEHKWEFIQGEVILHSPALLRHLDASGNLYQLLAAFVHKEECGSVYLEKALTSFPRNDYEPDIVYFGLAKTAALSRDTLRFPVPDLVVEVLSPSTESRDRGIKFQDYALHGVGEYWIIDTVAETVEIYVLPKGGQAYPATECIGSGMLESQAIPGFRIPVECVFNEKAARRLISEIYPSEALVQALSDVEDALLEKEQAIAELGQALVEKDQALVEKDQALVEKDHTLAKKEHALNEAEQQVQESLMEIARLKALLGQRGQ